MKSRRFFFVTVLLTGMLAVLGLSQGPARAEPHQKVQLGSATWLASLEEAQARSKATGKPILWLDMVGRLDEKWC